MRCAAYGELMGDGAPRLDGVEFAVLALGDTSYAEFCAIGKALDARFEALGGKRAAERADLDLDFEKPAADWIKGTLKALAPARVAATTSWRWTSPAPRRPRTTRPSRAASRSWSRWSST